MSDKITYNLISVSGKEAGSVELNPEIFAREIDTVAIHQVVRWQLAKKRSGTHATINLAKMDNNKKKPYKQKGTGRARCGSRYSPTRVGGAVAHGPQPRDYSFRLNKKTKKAALVAALSDKCQNNALSVFDKLELEDTKTRTAANMLKNIECTGKKILFLTAGDTDVEKKLQRAASNIQGVNFLNVRGLNTYDIINADCLLFDQNLLPQIEKQVLGGAE